MDTTTSDNFHGSAFNSVIALHCAGGTPHQWEGLAARLSSSFWLHTPSHIGSDASNIWHGERPFTLADEAARSLWLIDNSDASFHLVGHSYGGALALHIALARPDRIASMTLYEPCAFHLLAQSGSTTSSEYYEIKALASYITDSLSRMDRTAAMSRFVDYWSKPGMWQSLKPASQQALERWAPTATFEFEALINEKADANAYRKLNIPTRLLQGACSPAPVKAVSTLLADLMPQCTIEQLADLGHMGPITHADYIAGLTADHIHVHGSDQSFVRQAA